MSNISQHAPTAGYRVNFLVGAILVIGLMSFFSIEGMGALQAELVFCIGVFTSRGFAPMDRRAEWKDSLPTIVMGTLALSTGLGGLTWLMAPIVIDFFKSIHEPFPSNIAQTVEQLWLFFRFALALLLCIAFAPQPFAVLGNQLYAWRMSKRTRK